MALDKAAGVEEVGRQVLAAAMRVHSALGPGLLEGAYETCLAADLARLGVRVERQRTLPPEYEGQRIDAGYRLECSDSGGDDADDGDQAAEPGGRAGLGLKILQASVRQLSGTMAAGRDAAGYSTRLELCFTGD